MKIVGEDAFYIYYISYHYFKNFKKSPKFKHTSIVKITSHNAYILTKSSLNFKIIEQKL